MNELRRATILPLKHNFSLGQQTKKFKPTSNKRPSQNFRRLKFPKCKIYRSKKSQPQKNVPPITKCRGVVYRGNRGVLGGKTNRKFKIQIRNQWKDLRIPEKMGKRGQRCDRLGA